MRDRQKQHHEWWVANLERNRAVNYLTGAKP
jgi:hypothetical protein